MKKVICLLITVMMLVQCVGVVSAETWTDSVYPNVDMEVKRNGIGTFENGPLNISGNTAVVDLKTTLDMTLVKDKFVEWYDYAVGIINNMDALGGNPTDLMNSLNNLEINGQFVINIEYPDTLQLPPEFISNNQAMYGFDAPEIFYEISRSEAPGAQNSKVLTITIGVKGSQTANLTAAELYTYKDTYLDDITLTAEGVTIQGTGTHTVRGTLTGYTQTQGTISNAGSLLDEGSLRVNYTGAQLPGGENPSETGTISATVNLSATSSPGSSSGSVSSTSVTFNVDGDTSLVKPMNRVNLVKFNQLPQPTKPGYTFDGWYYDSAHTKKVEGDVKVNGNITLYGHFISNILDSEDHFAYIIGYPDGTVRPSNYISREEVTTVFYRLLRERNAIDLSTAENIFTDVSLERWSAKAILSMANAGFVKGYEDGSFGPEKYITRAEFATMATRYATLTENKDLSFTDISGHWAEEYINKAANAGWVNGYEDGSFGPQKYITRAEVMTIINRMLTRYVDEEGLHADTKRFTDMDGSEWYYYNVLEATNSHNYERREDGRLEKWTEITPNRIWIELDEMENAD